MGVDKELAMEERVHKTIRDYVVSTWLSGDERGFDDNTDLLQAGILDSFSTLNIAAFLDESFKTQLEPSEINPQNFRSVASLAAIVMAKLNS
jgi:clorobiocin biosynthesis protein CloN5